MLHRPPRRAGGFRSRKASKPRHLRARANQRDRIQAMPIIFNVRGPVFVSEQAPLPSGAAVGGIPVFRANAGRSEALRKAFREQVEQWKSDTQHWSSVTKMLAHPSYLRIIGLARLSTGYEIERLLLQELEAEPDHWFDALVAITGENPVKPDYDFDSSVDAWLNWGRQKGIVSN
jgi:hypothetical protein